MYRELNEVFTPGGMPKYTYIERTSRNVADELRSARGSGKLVLVTGLTKSGKTVLVQRIFPRDKSIWFDGGSFTSEEEFWNMLQDDLNLYNSLEEIETNTKSSDFTSEIKAEVGNGFFAKISSKITSILRKTNTEGFKRSRRTSSKSQVIRHLQKNKNPLVIDDFHYLPRDAQRNIIRALKSPIFNRVPVIFIAIPHRKFEVIKIEREMTGRVNNLDIPSWQDEELKGIALTGFPLLNVKFIDDTVINQLAAEACGSPHLMQEFCHKICSVNGINKTLSEEKLIDTVDFQKLFPDISEETGRQVFEKLKRGPRSRRDRKKRVLKDGTITDSYGVILTDRKSTRLNSSHTDISRMPSSA